MKNKYHIILFDGECTFCSFWVKFVLKRDKHDRFRFASLQSMRGIYLKDKHDIDDKIDSVVFIDATEKSFVKSNAVFEILFHLGSLGKLFYGFKIFPKFIRDFFYDRIAKLRYTFFKRKTCSLPKDANFKDKFI